MRDDFAIFILSHGRPDRVKTLSTLESMNYKGKVYILIDNEDKTADEYREKYGEDRVIMFDKQALSDNPKYDKFDKFDNKKVIFFARNACREVAEELGLKYYLQLDDDYTSFLFRFPEDGKLKSKTIDDFDEIIDLMIEFLNTSNALTVCFAQGGDFIGGVDGAWKKGLMRKAMNSFFCRTDKPFDFIGRINEDVNTYTSLGNKGELFFTVTNIALTQMATQANSGGMTELYLTSGTYVKTFYSVICSPQAVRVGIMGDSFKRIHHKINWNLCVPKILNERYKK